jgi:hypothetical protein
MDTMETRLDIIITSPTRAYGAKLERVIEDTDLRKKLEDMIQDHVSRHIEHIKTPSVVVR